MKIINFLLAVLIMIGIILLIAIIGVLALWLAGSDIIAFPGLGIVIATPLLLAFLISVEVMIIILAALLWRRRLVLP